MLRILGFSLTSSRARVHRVRVANELGAGSGKGARFATKVAVGTSVAIGIFFWLLILIFHNELALIFSSSEAVLQAVNRLSILLAFTVLLNSVQPVLSGNTTVLSFFASMKGEISTTISHIIPQIYGLRLTGLIRISYRLMISY